MHFKILARLAAAVVFLTPALTARAEKNPVLPEPFATPSTQCPAMVIG